jgi:PAS domain S-box-containing protein
MIGVMTTLPRTEHAVARSLAETVDPHDAMARALAAIGESLEWQFGAVWEPAAGQSEELSCTEVWHGADVDAAEFAAASRATPLASGEGLPGRVWQTGEPAWIEDVGADPNFPRAEAARTAGLHAAFCVPIRSARGVLGAIELFTADALEPDAELLATMGNIGDLIGLVVERRRDAEALRAKEARHRAMLDAALDCIVTMDHRGRVIDFNPAAERTFGHRATDVIGRDMAELIIPPELRERHARGLARYIATGVAAVLDRRIEITGMRSDGTRFPVELTITRIDVPGPPTFTGYLRDITDRVAAEAELKASRARILESADIARRHLERDLHDGAQQRLVELALDLREARGRIGDEPARSAELLDTALEDLAEATGELRDLARGIHPAALTDGGLRPALDALVSRSNVAARLVAVPTERFAAALEATIYFTAAEALTNAARYADATEVEIEVRGEEDQVMLEVRDDGRGGADPAGGSGLRGLADRAAALGGSMNVVSEAGSGTVLRVELPCA